MENVFTPEPVSGLDAMSYLKEAGVTVGWNLGNALDAHRGGVSGETIWGNPRIVPAIFGGVKRQGYQAVRIPITWMGHIGEGPDYRIEPAFMERVAEVVGFARDAGLKIIINIHHDGATEKDAAGTIVDQGWLSMNQARANPEDFRRINAQFERVWTQIATYFKNYGDYLMFESLNEVHDGNWGWGTDAVQRPQYEIVNHWNQLFVDTVRAVGGNNTGRYLIIPGYCTVPRHTTASYFRLPKDSANTVNRLIVTVHYYDPYEFAIIATRQSWGSDEDRRKVERDFQPLRDTFVTGKNVPVLIAEAGAVRQEGHEQARLDYVTHVFGTAARLGLIPFYWDNGGYRTGLPGERYGLFDRITGEGATEDAAELIRAMIDAAGR